MITILQDFIVQHGFCNCKNQPHGNLHLKSMQDISVCCGITFSLLLYTQCIYIMLYVQAAKLNHAKRVPKWPIYISIFKNLRFST